MQKSIFFYHPPDPRAYSSMTIYTPEGLRWIKLLELLVKLRVTKVSLILGLVK